MTDIFSRIINIVVGIIMILGGISQFFPPSTTHIIVGVYVIIFGFGKLHWPELAAPVVD